MLCFKSINVKGFFIIVISKYLKPVKFKLCKLLLTISIIDIFFLVALISEKKLMTLSIKYSSTSIISILFSSINCLIFIKLL